ncbi:MAG: right-handed parallel beta-helix repeat-containing protein [Clostridia bacterium]|nr:right-handed parallel beta-helix repeat-containing protein [Clostridia bacterium]
MKRLAYRFAAVLLAAAISLCLSVSCFAVGDFPGGETGLEIYVSPEGDDANPGTPDAPMRSLARVKDLLRERGGMFGGGATVYLYGGVYGFSEPLEFTAEDLPDVTYRAVPGETAVFSGAVPLTGFSETTVNDVRAFALKTEMTFDTLYHPTEEIRTPCYPDEGFFSVKDVDHADDLFTAETSYWSESRGNTSFNADPADIQIAFSQPERVWVRLLHGWLDEISHMTSYDADSGKVRYARPATFHTEPGDIYRFENVFEALDAPGEWYLDEDADELYYIPFDGETADDLILWAPVTSRLVTVDGAQGLAFEGIRFTQTEWTLSVVPDGNETRQKYNIDAYQAGSECDAALNIQNAENIAFRNCEFIDIGNSGLRFIKNVHHVTVENCILRRIGSTAVAVYGENVPDSPEALSDFRIVNNLIESYGRNTNESIGVHMMYVRDSAVAHNEIRDGFYTGISCGWIWGHEPQVTKNVSIRDNLIHEIGQGRLSDLGGIYMLGEQEGTVLSGNVICNVVCTAGGNGRGGNGYGGNGIYTDAGSSFFTIEKNLVFDCSANGINLGGLNYGHTVRNNIAVFCNLSAFDPGSCDIEGGETCVCENNIFVSDNAPVILNLERSAQFTERANLLWDLANGAHVFGSDGYSGNYENKVRIPAFHAKLNGFLKDDVIADPLFADAAARDFTLAPDSPAFGTGFEAWDYAAAGLRKDTAVGCGSEYAPGEIAVSHDLSNWPKGCTSKLSLLIYFYLGCALLLLLAAAAISLVRFKKTPAPSAVRVLRAAAPLAAALALLLTHHYFKYWNPPLYVAFALLFSVLAALPAASRVYLRAKHKILAVLPVLLFIGLFFGAAGGLHMLFDRAGLPVTTAAAAAAAPIAAMVFLEAKLKKRRPAGTSNKQL